MYNTCSNKALHTFCHNMEEALQQSQKLKLVELPIELWFDTT